MVGALWIDSGSDTDSDSGHRRTRRSQDVGAVAGPSRLTMRKSPRRAGSTVTSGSIIALSSSQDLDQPPAARSSNSGKQSTADKVHASQASNPTPGQRMARLLADPSPDTSLPSFRDLLRSRSTAATSSKTDTLIAANGGSSRPAPGSDRAGTLRRTASQPVSSSQEEGPSSSLSSVSVRRNIRKAATNVTAKMPEVIEIGSDSIVDPVSEGDLLLPLSTQNSSPIRSQFSARGQQLGSSQPIAYSPPKARTNTAVVNGGREVVQAEGRLDSRAPRQTYRAESAPIVILSSSPPPPASVVMPRASQNGNAIEDIPEQEFPDLPPSSFPFDDAPLSPLSSPFRAERRDVVDALPTLKRRAAAAPVTEEAREVAPAPARKRAKPMGRTTSLLDALDNLYVPDDHNTTSRNDVQTTEPPKIASATNVSPSKAAKQAAAQQAREAKSRQREAAKATKLRLAAEKKRFLEVNRLRTSKSDTMRELITDLDRMLFAPGQPLEKCEDSVKARFEEEGAEVNLCDGVVAPPLVRFRRKVKADWDEGRRCWVPLEEGGVKVRREGMVVVLMDAKEVVRMVGEEGGGEGLERWYGDLKRRLAVLNTDRGEGQAGKGGEEQVFLICQGLVKYYSRLRANENRAYTARIRQQLAENQPDSNSTSADTAPDTASKTSRRKNTSTTEPALPPAPTTSTVPPQSLVEKALLTLKLIHRCYVIHASSLVDSIEWLHQLASDLSLKPYKSLRDTHLSFAVDTGRNTTSSSSSSIYTMMLQQIPRVTPAIAASISTIYPSLHSLVKAYEQCAGDEEEERGLLAGVRVESNKDGTERRRNRMNLGKELSKRVREVVRGTNGDVVVSHSTKD